MIKIREFISSDTAPLQQLFLEVRQATFLWKDPAEFDVMDFDSETEGEQILVAVCDNKVVGFISTWIEDAFIHHLYVDASYQNQGVGKALLTNFLSRVHTAVQLKCLLKNEQAIAFYKRNNFIEKKRVVAESGDYILFEYIPHLDSE